jgi:hypothetical protein
MRRRKTGGITANFDADNAEAARVILEDPKRYPVGSLLWMWARRVMEKQQVEEETSNVEPKL